MAIYRTVHLSFWTDSKVVDDFTPEDKYFYLYLMTNPHTNLCGCYEISINQASNETGYNKETVERLLRRMDTVHNVIRYSPGTKEVLVINWSKYNWTKSEDFHKPLRREITAVKNADFREYLSKLEEGVGTVWGRCGDGAGITVTDTVSVTDTVTDTVSVSEMLNDTDIETFSDGYSFPDITSRWNELEHLGITPIRGIKKGSKREEAVRRLVRSYGEDDILIAINNIRSSPFLLGKKKDFIIVFDWFIKPANFQKVLEGNYKERGAVTDTQSIEEDLEARMKRLGLFGGGE